MLSLHALDRYLIPSGLLPPMSSPSSPQSPYTPPSSPPSPSLLQKKVPPFLVRLTLLGVHTRKALLCYFWFSIVMTVALIIWGGWVGTLGILAAAMYGWALKWMDKHGDWQSPRG